MASIVATQAIRLENSVQTKELAGEVSELNHRLDALEKHLNTLTKFPNDKTAANKMNGWVDGPGLKNSKSNANKVDIKGKDQLSRWDTWLSDSVRVYVKLI